MDDYSGPMKLLLSYNVKTDTLQEYYPFVMQRYIPTMHSMGVKMIEAWSTAYGDAPNRLIAFATDDVSTMHDAMDSDVWDKLNTRLEDFVTDLEFKLVPLRDGFQF